VGGGGAVEGGGGWGEGGRTDFWGGLVGGGGQKNFGIKVLREVLLKEYLAQQKKKEGRKERDAKKGRENIEERT